MGKLESGSRGIDQGWIREHESSEGYFYETNNEMINESEKAKQKIEEIQRFWKQEELREINEMTDKISRKYSLMEVVLLNSVVKKYIKNDEYTSYLTVFNEVTNKYNEVIKMENSEDKLKQLNDLYIKLIKLTMEVRNKLSEVYEKIQEEVQRVKNNNSTLKNVVYERAIKTYGGGGVETEYYPVMENGSMVVKKTSADGILITGSNYGVIDSSKKEIVPCIYDSCNPINTDYYIVGKDYTTGGMYGDDYSLSKQKYGIVDSDNNVIVPLEMKNIFCKDGNIFIYGFNNEYYIGLINNGKIELNEGMPYTMRDSLEDIYNAISGTKKIAYLRSGFILKDGEYADYQEFINAYYDFNNRKNLESISNEEVELKNRTR